MIMAPVSHAWPYSEALNLMTGCRSRRAEYDRSIWKLDNSCSHRPWTVNEATAPPRVCGQEYKSHCRIFVVWLKIEFRPATQKKHGWPES